MSRDAVGRAGPVDERRQLGGWLPADLPGRLPEGRGIRTGRVDEQPDELSP